MKQSELLSKLLNDENVLEILHVFVKEKYIPKRNLIEKLTEKTGLSENEVTQITKLLFKLVLIYEFSNDDDSWIELTPRGYYLVRLWGRTDHNEICSYIFAEPGDILLKGDNLFTHPLIRIYHEYLLEIWRPIPFPIALYLPCSKHKPYSRSFMQLKIRRMLHKRELSKYVQVYIVSEPLVLVPAQIETLFPAAHYDYPPEKVSEDEKNIYVTLLRKILRRLENVHRTHVYSLPRFHKMIFLKAVENRSEKYLYVPYNVYYIPKLAEVLTNGLDRICNI
ncbi:MAG: DUF5591 domain-containing protein [Candidatus Njordarchaeales archaeon]